MMNSLIRMSYRIVFPVFVLSLLFSVVYGLYLLWNPDLMTEHSVRMLSTSLVLVTASLFYTGLCDAWFRIIASAKENDRG